MASVPSSSPRDAAPFVAEFAYYGINGSLADADSPAKNRVWDRAAVEQLRDAVPAHYVTLLEQVAWGDPPADVTLTADETLLRHIGEDMLGGESTGAYREPLTSEQRRERVIEITAGASILDQLDDQLDELEEATR